MALLLRSRKRPGDYPVTIGSETVLGHYFEISLIILIGKVTVDAHPTTILSLTCL